MKRYSIRVEYVGKNFYGSQKQGGKSKNLLKTVQAELENALSTLINKKIKTVFSGRTDRGVNSKGQIVHFDLDEILVASKFIYSLNEILPDDISISDLKEVSADFHAQKSAVKRHYQYVFYHKPERSAFDGDLLLIMWKLDFNRMQKALNYLLGEHDFRSFEKSGATTPNKTCFIYNIKCQKLDNNMVVIDIMGNRFLHNMVRTIVGTLLMIERKNLPAETMKTILEAKDRSKAGKNVNPHGLTLMKVEY